MLTCTLKNCGGELPQKLLALFAICVCMCLFVCMCVCVYVTRATHDYPVLVFVICACLCVCLCVFVCVTCVAHDYPVTLPVIYVCVCVCVCMCHTCDKRLSHVCICNLSVCVYVSHCLQCVASVLQHVALVRDRIRETYTYAHVCRSLVYA